MDKATKPAGTATASDSADTSLLGSSGGEVIATAAGVGQELQHQVVGLTHQARQQATDQFVTQKARVVDTLDMVALLLRQSGEHAQLQEKAMLAGYLDKASGEVGKWSKLIDARDPAQLIAETRQFANRQPLVFVGGALAAGFLGTRFLRSSAQQQPPTTNAGGYRPSDDQRTHLSIPKGERSRDSDGGSSGVEGATGAAFADALSAERR